jgi:hypothetical protein
MAEQCNEFYIVPPIPCETDERSSTHWYLFLHVDAAERYHALAREHCVVEAGDRPSLSDDTYIGYYIPEEMMRNINYFLKMDGAMKVQR